jgi:enoyl-CoA hydratase/carnithine racemase
VAGLRGHQDRQQGHNRILQAGEVWAGIRAFLTRDAQRPEERGVVYGVADGVAQVRIDRPAKKNALTARMYADLTAALQRAERDPSVRVIVLLGAPGVFTAGNDLQEFLHDPPTGVDRPVHRFMQALSGATKVVIAGVAGLAVGIGTTLLLHCDLVVAGRGARFSLPFVDLGLVPEFASSLLLPRLIGRARASKHLLLAEPFDAPTALDYGLVSELVDDAEVERVALQWARHLVRKAPGALRETKRLVDADAQRIQEQIALESAAFSARLRSDEAREALAAFVHKRAPRSSAP